MTFLTLYLVMLALSFGGWFAIKYSVKGMEKAGVFDDNYETRYTPPTESTYLWFAALMAVVGMLIVLVWI